MHLLGNASITSMRNLRSCETAHKEGFWSPRSSATPCAPVFLFFVGKVSNRVLQHKRIEHQGSAEVNRQLWSLMEGTRRVNDTSGQFCISAIVKPRMPPLRKALEAANGSKCRRRRKKQSCTFTEDGLQVLEKLRRGVRHVPHHLWSLEMVKKVAPYHLPAVSRLISHKVQMQLPKDEQSSWQAGWCPCWAEILKWLQVFLRRNQCGADRDSEIREFFPNLDLNSSLCSARVTHASTNHTLEGVFNFLETIRFYAGWPGFNDTVS